MVRKVRFIILFVLFVLLGGFFLREEISAPVMAATDGADQASQSSGTYKELGVRSGVWNDGAAALWDLDIVDQFRWFGPPERARGYSPAQPINFSHVTHVQKNQIECQFCHWTVAKSAFAAIPEVETCMGCHRYVAGQTPEAKAEINKISEHFNGGKQIPWEKVHVMPDYVRFNHKRHVKGGVACHECHGQVPEMQTVERVTTMKMGWCVDCHREKGASIDCYTCHK